MNVSLITSVPVVPPWDQGDKNLAHVLARAMPQHRFRVMTARDELSPPGENLDPQPVYRSRHPSLLQKAGVYWQLLRGTVPSPSSPESGAVPDLYHLVYQPYRLSSWLSRLLPEFRRRPTLHTVPATANGLPLGRDLFFADQVVTLSEYGRQALRQLGLENVMQIPPGIEVDHWRALKGQTEHLKARLGLAGYPVVLFPGHYGPGQGAEVMLRALPTLAAQVPTVRVIFACRLRSPADRERETAFRQAIDLMRLAKNARFFRTVADMQTLIGASDLVVLPLETMRDKVDTPTTLVEALAVGKPIAISDLPPMNELVKGDRGDGSAQGDVGLAVPPGNAEALAQGMVALLTDSGLRERMGRRGQELVQDRFDIRQVARRYDKLYQEMVG